MRLFLLERFLVHPFRGPHFAKPKALESHLKISYIAGGNSLGKGSRVHCQLHLQALL